LLDHEKFFKGDSVRSLKGKGGGERGPPTGERTVAGKRGIDFCPKWNSFGRGGRIFSVKTVETLTPETGLVVW